LLSVQNPSSDKKNFERNQRGGWDYADT